MKGDIFILLEKFIEANFSREMVEEVYSDISDRLKTIGPFVGPEVYPDEDFMLMFESTLRFSKLEASKALRAFGNFCLPRLIAKKPEFLGDFHNPVGALKSLDSIIHLEVRKSCPFARTPRFKVGKLDGDGITLSYSSPRKLYDFAEGMIEGLAVFYKKKVQISRSINVDGSCEFKIDFRE